MTTEAKKRWNYKEDFKRAAVAQRIPSRIKRESEQVVREGPALAELTRIEMRQRVGRTLSRTAGYWPNRSYSELLYSASRTDRSRPNPDVQRFRLDD
jgi:hypothetical protein